MASDWQRGAACVTADPDLFLAEEGAGLRKARKFCAVCPVREACLAAAMLEEAFAPAADRAGVRGGLTPQQRADKAKREPRPVNEPCHQEPATKPREQKATRSTGPVVCGTRGGYQKHRRNDEKPCDACRHANTAADRRLRTTGSTVPAPAAAVPAA
ncbi:WhiB family transcriptional regulator [Streptomyces sp. V1I6]|uniref:WhiB family transcriptional regulator n=1 Tax=Streptomyces sp. V1I6 TaxID=3042273 RepID=UPI0027881676|nr:WhiB family transcriptional regulator [Streptomyces sp. V1I6]MDQ0842439.1 hypothetical protein [Streptomyces sp. V1I6]